MRTLYTVEDIQKMLKNADETITQQNLEIAHLKGILTRVQSERDDLKTEEKADKHIIKCLRESCEDLSKRCIYMKEQLEQCRLQHVQKVIDDTISNEILIEQLNEANKEIHELKRNTEKNYSKTACLNMTNELCSLKRQFRKYGKIFKKLGAD